MAEKLLSLILYPAMADGLSQKEKATLRQALDGVEGIDSNRLVDAVQRRLSREEMQKLAAQVPKEDRATYFALAKQVASIDDPRGPERAGLRELRDALGIRVEEAVEGEIPQEEVQLGPDEGSVEQISIKYSKIAGAVGLVPVPLVTDLLVILPLQAQMVRKISRLYDFPMDAKKIVDMGQDKAGMTYLFMAGGREILELVPVVGWMAAGSIAFSGTYAIAMLAREYIEHQGDMDEQAVKRTYRQAYEAGKRQFNAMKDDILANKDKLLEQLKKFYPSEKV